MRHGDAERQRSAMKAAHCQRVGGLKLSGLPSADILESTELLLARFRAQETASLIMSFYSHEIHRHVQDYRPMGLRIRSWLNLMKW